MNLITIGQYKFYIDEGPIIKVWPIDRDDQDPPMLILHNCFKTGIAFIDEKDALDYAVAHFTEIENNNQQS